MLPRIIGITGIAGAGKDTLADYLVKEHGYTKYALARPLKKLLNERFGWTDEQWNDREWKEKEDCMWGWAWPKQTGHRPFSPRSWAQWLGTEVGRTIGGEDVWVNLMRKFSFSVDKLVVPDVRFDNEARAIHNLGGRVLKVTRPGIVPVGTHISENGVTQYLVDCVAWNGDTIEDYIKGAVRALEIANV